MVSIHPKEADMWKPGDRVLMTKGYAGTYGVINEKTDSPFEIYIITLDSSIKIVAGPSAFASGEGRDLTHSR
jgi:hypothetical protein